MTRLASIMGMATVATMVLLSGCDQAMEKDDTDYAAALAGTWMSDVVSHQIVNPKNPMDPMDLVDITSVATVTIGEHAADSFTITITDVIPPTTEPFLVSTATGIFTATVDAISVSVSSTDPPSVASLLDDGVLEFDYEATDTELKLSGSILVEVGITQSEDEQLTLTKQ